MKTYLAKFNPKVNGGVYAISLVENPAMEGLFIALSKQEEIKFAEVDKEQRILMGLVLEPNKPVYRNQGGEEFNIVFNEETIKELSHNFFKLGYQQNSTIEHEKENKIDGVTFVESWIVEDSEIDKSANFGFSYPKGSWIATMKVDSDEVWNNYVKTGKVQGFSVDALLSLEEVKLSKNQTIDGLDIWFKDAMMVKGTNVQDLKGNNLKDGKYQLMSDIVIDVKDGEITDIQEVNLNTINMSKEAEKSLFELLKDLPNQIKLALTPKKEVEVQLGSIKLADGSLTLEFDGEVMTPDGAVWIMADDGTKVPAPIGEHLLEDESTLIITEEGKIGEVKPKAMEQMAGEQPPSNNDAQIAEEISTAIKSILIKYSEIQEELKEVRTELKSAQEDLIELGKQPASKGITQPEAVVDLSKMGKKERLFHTINNQKN
jgi:hypothetical protein